MAEKFAQTLHQYAIEKTISDIHFNPAADQVAIYFRQHGERTYYDTISHQFYNQLLAYYKFSSGMDIGERTKPQNGSMHLQHIKKRFDLRLSTLPIQHTESLAIRILPHDQIYTLDELFLFPYQCETIKQLLSNQSGVILFTGPTGCGKSTTMYAILEALLEKDPYQVITLEDPIERKIPRLLQVQMNDQAGITYHTGLKAALRHDPDILMVGEIRDHEVAKFVFEVALTGHLVISTLHAQHSIGTIHRLINMGVSKEDIEHSLIAVCSNELLPIRRGAQTVRRAAILEILHGEPLQKALNGKLDNTITLKNSFDHLRKKAYAYGFISENELYERTSFPITSRIAN